MAKHKSLLKGKPSLLKIKDKELNPWNYWQSIGGKLKGYKTFKKNIDKFLKKYWEL